MDMLKVGVSRLGRQVRHGEAGKGQNRLHVVAERMAAPRDQPVENPPSQAQALRLFAAVVLRRGGILRCEGILWLGGILRCGGNGAEHQSGLARLLFARLLLPANRPVRELQAPPRHLVAGHHVHRIRAALQRAGNGKRQAVGQISGPGMMNRRAPKGRRFHVQQLASGAVGLQQPNDAAFRLFQRQHRRCDCAENRLHGRVHPPVARRNMALTDGQAASRAATSCCNSSAIRNASSSACAALRRGSQWVW